jgi:hypothetical protein
MDSYQKTSIDRPGCVTAYTIFLWLTAAAYIIFALIIGLPLLSESAGAGIVLLFCGLAVAGIPVTLGIGLWQMKKWACALVLIFQGMGVLGSLLSMFGVYAASNVAEAISFIGRPAVGLLISGGIMYWFIDNRHQFDQDRYVLGPDGQVIKKPADNTAVIIAVVGAVAVMCLLPIVIIAVLTLLGPQIGDVFSRIITELE